MNLPLHLTGSCDCHSHIYGPFDCFPLSSARVFNPPEATAEQLGDVWQSLGINRAVLIQGNAYGTDLSAMLAAIATAPESRRGVAVLPNDISAERLAEIHAAGIRAVRFNWSRHLLTKDARSDVQRLDDSVDLLEAIAPFGMHVEIHLDAPDLHLFDELEVPTGMKVVIDHMARIDLAESETAKHMDQLIKLLGETRFWVKLSGADRATSRVNDLQRIVPFMQRLVSTAPDRCVWGLDWPHVNLKRRRSDVELAETLKQAAGDSPLLRQILIVNPETLYGF